MAKNAEITTYATTFTILRGFRGGFKGGVCKGFGGDFKKLV